MVMHHTIYNPLFKILDSPRVQLIPPVRDSLQLPTGFDKTLILETKDCPYPVIPETGTLWIQNYIISQQVHSYFDKLEGLSYATDISSNILWKY